MPDNIAAIVNYTRHENGAAREATAVVEFDSNFREGVVRQDGGDDRFHTVVTVFVPDTTRGDNEFDYVEYLLANPDNIELEIERNPETMSATGETIPNAQRNEVSKGSIADTSENVNTKYSISTRDPQKQEILDNLRRYMAGDMSHAQISSYIDNLDPWKKPERILPTYEQSEAERVVDTAHRQGMDVREYINQNWELFERDGEMNDIAREAVAMERKYTRYSIDEEADQDTVSGYLDRLIEQDRQDWEDPRSDLNKKAQEQLKATERTLLAKVADALHVPRTAQRDYLQDIVKEITDNYMRNGTVEPEALDHLFETAYQHGLLKWMRTPRERMPPGWCDRSRYRLVRFAAYTAKRSH